MQRSERFPPHLYFVVSAVFHYLGPSFAVLLFARVPVLGVAWLRIASAAVVFAVWRRPWRAFSRVVLVWGVVLALMNCAFYSAIARLPLATVAAVEFLPVVGLAAFGARTRRNWVALALAASGVYVLTGVRLAGEGAGVAFAFANALLFGAYIVLADRVAKRGRAASPAPVASPVDSLAAAMLVAAVVVTPIGLASAAPALSDPVALLAGIGVGVSSSVIPYVLDQLALARLPRATYALMVALLPAMAALIGLVVLVQVPSGRQLAGIGLVAAGVALHRPAEAVRRRRARVPAPAPAPRTATPDRTPACPR